MEYNTAHSVMYTMNTLSSIAFYNVLLLCYNLVHSINTDSRNKNVLKSQNLNGILSTAERFRRLVPYVTYYVVGNNENNNVQYQYQTPNPNLNTLKPQINNFYLQNENKIQQKQPIQYQHNYQILNHLPQQHTTPEYLRFPSSPKILRPKITTTEIPYTVQTEKAYNYYYDYSQTSPRPNTIKYEYEFLPTISPIPFSQLKQEYSTTTKKIRPKPKRPTTQITTTTTDKYNALNELLNSYDLKNQLSNKITSENIGSNIQTLSTVLQILRNEADDQVKQKKSKPDYTSDSIDEYDTSDVGNPGKPGIDYPTLSVIPKTSFDCKTQRYKGFFGDPETHCQVWHYCDLNGGQASFLCPNGTIFNQVSLTCDWWFNVKCDTTTQLYVLNERLYKYIIPHKPSFPEDYEGPLVDRYLEDKFQETEKKRNQSKEPILLIMNITTVKPDSARTPYQQLLDVDI